MRLTSPSRRVLGVFAASAIGMSTAVLGVTGVAQASSGPFTLTASTPLDDPRRRLHRRVGPQRRRRRDRRPFAGGAGVAHGHPHVASLPATPLTADRVTLAGGAAGTGGGAGGDGIGPRAARRHPGGGRGRWRWCGHAGRRRRRGNSGGGYRGTTYSYNGGQPGQRLGGRHGGYGRRTTTSGTDGGDGVDHVGGAGCRVGAGGGGGGLFGGGGGASDGTDGAGGGGGSDLQPDGADADGDDGDRRGRPHLRVPELHRGRDAARAHRPDRAGRQRSADGRLHPRRGVTRA